jgi:single-strand selective monofunctional uracil DNA glycosylase
MVSPMGERALVRIAADLATRAGRLGFGPPVEVVYNPLDYAWKAHAEYLRRYGAGRKRVVFVGMNPGPWGMVQTGIPFGEVETAREWLGIRAAIGAPARLHPRRPVAGWACARSEPSGRRLWGLMRERFGTPQAFFADHFVANYCPLAFFDLSGANLTPDRLRRQDARALEEVCDEHLRRAVAALSPEWVIGVGGYAASRLRAVCGAAAKVESILHPSPASPAANKGWAAAVTKRLEDLGIWK